MTEALRRGIELQITRGNGEEEAINKVTATEPSTKDEVEII